MAADEEMEESGEEDFPISEELIDGDMPCIRCGYNLRGHEPEGRCPECGAGIGRTMGMVTQEVLCPTCLRPNHVTAVECAHCTGAIKGAAGVANYYRTSPRAGRGEEEEEEWRSPSPVMMVVCWVICLPALMFLVGVFAEDWWSAAEAHGATAAGLAGRAVGDLALMGVAGFLPLVFVYGATRRYLKRKRSFEAGKVKREQERSGQEEAGKMEEEMEEEDL